MKNMKKNDTDYQVDADKEKQKHDINLVSRD